MDFVAVPAVYISHISVPVVFFKRYLIYEFALFYCIFHLMTFGVSISFTGYVFIWMILFDFRTAITCLRNNNAVSRVTADRVQVDEER